MKPAIVVDATPLISALIGGFSREVLFSHDFDFITTDYTMEEVKKFVPLIAEKAGVSEESVFLLMSLLPLTVYDEGEYSKNITRARSLISDPKDAPILALAITQNLPLWSNDKHFEQVPGLRLIKTKDFV